MKKIFRSLLVLSAVFFLSTNSYAIPDSYGTAPHNTKKWQELASYDADNNLVDEYGVSWSIDGGVTWGRDDLTVGQTVNFKYDLHKKNVGTHYADLLKSWVDWDQDGQFDSPTDVVAYGIKPLLDPGENNFSFISEGFEILDSYVGDVWLRARVACSESLVAVDGGNWEDQWSEEYKQKYEEIFYATGKYNQGEAEDWKLTINAAPVPEPTTMLLLGFGLIGLAGIGRRKNK